VVIGDAVSEQGGFGAPDADWKDHHVPTPGYAPGTVYAGGVYTSVVHQAGRVLSYTRNFPPATRVGLALDRVREEDLPRDTAVVWDLPRDRCLQVLLRSALLGASLAAPGLDDPSGRVLVTLYSGPSREKFSKDAVTEAVVLPAESVASPADAPGC